MIFSVICFQRFFNRWLHLKAEPQTLLDKIDPFGEKDEVHKQLKIIVEMLYRSWNYLRIKTAVRNFSG